MVKLKPDQYEQVSALITDKNASYPLMHSVLDGVIEGQVYADCVPCCKTAFIRSKNNWVYLLGEEESPGFISEVLTLFGAQHDGYIIWFGIPNLWRKRMAAHCTCKISDHPRYRYTFLKSGFPAGKPPPVAFEIQPIDQHNRKQAEAFSGSISAFWGDGQTFLKRSFGYIALEDGCVRGISMAASITKDKIAEIDIETHAGYRGRGIAKALTYSLIQQCVDRGMTPKWDCMINNEPSTRLAAYFGFQIVEAYPVSYITFQ